MRVPPDERRILHKWDFSSHSRLPRTALGGGLGANRSGVNGQPCCVSNLSIHERLSSPYLLSLPLHLSRVYYSLNPYF